MKVTIRDHRAEAKNWGYGRCLPVLTTVTISNACPVCGHPRGEPKWSRFCDDGDWYNVHVWTNDCGHIDRYDDVLREADQLTVIEDAERAFYDAYCEECGERAGDLQNDTPEYRAAYYRSDRYRPMPTFEDWLTQRVVADVENAYYDAYNETLK